jgi:hypothetical protein
VSGMQTLPKQLLQDLAEGQLAATMQLMACKWCGLQERTGAALLQSEHQQQLPLWQHGTPSAIPVSPSGAAACAPLPPRGLPAGC